MISTIGFRRNSALATKTKFLFWNLNRKPLQEIVANLALSYEVDVFMLVECTIAPGILMTTLNQRCREEYYYAPGIGCKKVEILTRYPRRFIQPIHEADRLTIRHLKLPWATDILLAVTHFPSKLHWSDSSQAFESIELANSIRLAEKQAGHSRTLLVGDLNMNPFEDGVVSASGLHGVISRRIAEKRKRVVQAREYPLFYNPMWNLFGDATPGPPGTYYYSKSEHKVFFWNMFDQVLIRPDLLSLFSNENLEILTSDGNTSFLSSQGMPDTNVASDHLPIFFKLEL